MDYKISFKEWLKQIDYLDIGHRTNYSDEDDVDAYVLKRNYNDITTAKRTGRDPDDFHGENLYKNIDYSGRIDHNKRNISISSRDSNDEDRLNYLISILKQDYPDYDLWYFSYGNPKKVG